MYGNITLFIIYFLNLFFNTRILVLDFRPLEIFEIILKIIIKYNLENLKKGSI